MQIKINSRGINFYKIFTKPIIVTSGIDKKTYISLTTFSKTKKDLSTTLAEKSKFKMLQLFIYIRAIYLI